MLMSHDFMLAAAMDSNVHLPDVIGMTTAKL